MQRLDWRRTAVAASILAGAQALALELTPPAGPGATPLAPWRVTGLPKQTKPLTTFTVVDLAGHRVLRIESDHAYGNLVHPLPGAAAGTLEWRWRVDRPVVGADLHRRAGDDAALKVCALFDMPLERVPFLERQLLRLAEARAGEKLPTATLCYVWDDTHPDGLTIHNAFTHRLRFIVVHRSLQQWSQERRDLAADFRRTFGDESSEVPPLIAVAVGADSDNTGSHSVAYVDDLRLHSP